MEEDSGSPAGITPIERAWLGLVFGGPLPAWLAMARIMRVPVEPDAEASEPLFAQAEAGARTAARWFPYGLGITTLTVVAFILWSPVQTRLLEPFMHVSFHAVAEDVLANGGPNAAAIIAASATMMAMGTIVGLLNASVFGAIPLYVLRRSTAAAAPAVSVALAKRDGTLVAEQYASYPRLALAVETILNRRRRLGR